MILRNKSKKVFKVISALMAGIFLFNQIAWAGDLINAALDQQYKDQTQTFAPSYLQNQQSAVEIVISQKQAIEDAINTQYLTASMDTQAPADESLDLKGPRGDSGGQTAAVKAMVSTQGVTQTVTSGDSAIISVTTVGGDKISYKGGKIDSIERSDKTIIKVITMGNDNSPIDADITYADGTIQEVRGGKVSKVTNPDKTSYNYLNDRIVSMSDKYGVIITTYDYKTDNDGQAVTLLTHSDKKVYYGADNLLKRVEYNTGKTVYYDSGLLNKVVDADGTSYLYSSTPGDGATYIVSLSEIDSQGARYFIKNNNIVTAKLSNGRSYSFPYVYSPVLKADFNRDGKTDFDDFQVLLDNWQSLDMGFLGGDSNGDGKTDFLDFQTLLDNWGRSEEDPVTLTLPGAMFNNDGTLKVGYDFTRTAYFDTIIYGQDRKAITIIRPDGKEIAYNDGFMNGISQITEGIEINRDGIKRIYDDYGDLSKVSIDGVSTFFNNGVVSRIEKEDGTIIENATFDESDNIVSAIVTKPDGIKTTYEGGVLTKVDQPDGSVFYYDTYGNITKAKNVKGVTYIYKSAERGGMEADAEDQDSITDPEEVVYQKYDSNKRLVEAHRKNGAILSYSYTFNASGGVEFTIVTDAVNKTIITYGKNNKIIKTEVSRQAAEPSTISEYEYDRIRRVYKGDKLIYSYTYEFDSDGKEVTVIEDTETKDLKRYKDELLMSVTDKNGLITTYEYDADKKIKKSAAAYLGRVVNEYAYTYEGDLTTIEDMDAVKRTYDKDDKLTLLEESGKTYAYTYQAGSDGRENTIQELVNVRDGSGSTANYESGVLKSIIKSNGAELSDFVFTDDNIVSYTIQKSDIKYFVEDDKVVKELWHDSTIIKYSANGMVTSFTDPAGKVTHYDYEYSSAGEVSYIVVKKDDLSFRYDKEGVFIELIDEQARRYYYDNLNRLIKIDDANNKTDYTYEYSGDSTIAKILAEKIFDVTNDLSKFRISDLSLSDKIDLKSYTDLLTPVNPNYYRIPDIGDGSNGVKHVTTNETLAAGTYNYISLTIDAGKTLTLASGTVIKCLGVITINGKLAGDNSNILAHTITIGTNGYLSGSGQHLSANTINNLIPADIVNCDRGTYSYDNDYSTYEGDSGSRPGRGDFGLGPYTTTTTYTFGSPKNLTQIDYRAYTFWYANGQYPNGGSNWNVSINYGSGFVTLWSGDGDTGHVTQTGVWNGATQLQLYTYARAGGDRDGYATAYSYELQFKSSTPIYDYINRTGNLPASANTSGYVNALKYYQSGWIGKDGVRAYIASQISGSPSLLNDLYHGDRIYSRSGTLISDPIAITGTSLDSIIANIDTPAGTSVRFSTKTGASADLNDGSWSGWVEATKDATGYKINSIANKYIQCQAILESSNGVNTPSIYSNGDYAIKLNYSYNNSFDATAPPEDLLFKEFLKFTPPDIPILPQSAILRPDFTLLVEDPDNIESRILPGDTVIETESYRDDLSRDVSKQSTIDNRITYFVDNKMTETYQKYSDGRIELLTQYSYGEEGTLLSVRLPYARSSIEREISSARQSIAQERAAYLRNLSAQKGLAYTQIRDQVQLTRNQINAERSRLQPMLYQEVTKSKWVGWWIFGWWETYRETVEVPEVRSALNTLNEQERLLNNEESIAYAALNSEVSAVEVKLTEDESSALTQIGTQEKQFQGQIIKEESTPVILECYRAVLGRDPDDAETAAWLAKVTYDTAINVDELKAALQNSDERRQQEALVASLKNHVKETLDNYVNLSQEGKGSFLGTLGLVLAEAVTLGTKDVDAILSFLNEQNIHFGRSAFVSIEALLKENNIPYELEDLALKTILIDIFTGSLNALSENKLLELSMYSLSKAAESYGLTLYNTKLNFDDLKELSQQSKIGTVPEGDCPILPVIAHLKNNHYVVVTNIAVDGKISYKEHNKGQGGYTWTVSKEDFEKGWTGYAIVQAPSTVIPAEAGIQQLIQTKQISAYEAQRIKGSCLEWLFLAVVWIFGGIAAAATAAVGAITAIVTGISAVIGPIIAGIGALITNVAGFMVGIGSQLFSAISFVGTSLLSGIGYVGAWLGGVGAALGNALGLSGIITSTGFNLTGLGFALGKTIVTTVLSIGISRGLEALGVNSTISGLLSAFVSGGVSGLFNSGFSVLSFLTSGLQGLAIQGINALAPRLGIDPMLTNVISMAAGALIGAVGKNISPTTGQFNFESFSASIGKQIAPTIASEFAYYGITKTGELLGIDPRISYLAGIGIRSSLQAGLSSNMDPGAIWNSVTTGLLQGVTNIGLNYLAQEMGINPLLANIGFSAISTALQAGIQSFMPQGKKDVFKAMFETYEKNTLTFLGYAEPGTTISPWQQAAYISQILDFSNIVQERGLTDALNAYGAGFFNAVAVNAIVKTGYTLGGYFANKLQTGQYRIETVNGQEVAAVDTPTQSDGGHSTGFFKWVLDEGGVNGIWDPLGLGVTSGNGDTSWTIGEIGKDGYAKMGFYDDTTMYNKWGDLGIWQTIDNGNQTYAEIKDNAGNIIFVVEPRGDGGYNYYNSYGDYVDAVIKSYENGYNVSLKNGAIFNQGYRSSIFEGEDDGLSWFESLGISKDMLSNMQDDVTIDASGKVSHNLYWQADNSQPIPTNFIEALKAPEAKERIGNYLEGFEYRTNAEITDHFDDNATLLKTAYPNGAIISVRGRGFSADLIKAATGGPINHTAFMYINDAGERYVIQEKGPFWWNGLEKYKLDDWLTTYKATGADINVGYLSTDPQVAVDIKNSIERNLFYWNRDANGNWTVTDELIPMPYDTTNLVGIHVAGNICSSLAVMVYKDGNHPIFMPDAIPQDDQLQYSPNDVYKRLKLLGYVD